jgi:long-chain acyl-CoA synthetase
MASGRKIALDLRARFRYSYTLFQYTESELAMQTIDAVIRQRCLTHADRPALRQKQGETWQACTYGQLWATSDRLAAGLIRDGFRPGEHAAIYAPSSIRWVTAYLGILKAGGVVVPVDKELKSAELRHLLGDSDARVIFTDAGYLDTALESSEHLPQLRRIVLLHPPPNQPADQQTAVLLDALESQWQSIVEHNTISQEQTTQMTSLINRLHGLLASPGGKRSNQRRTKTSRSPLDPSQSLTSHQGGILTFDSLLFEAPLPANSRRPDETAVILYTSGTTGRAKGAMLSHRNIIANIVGCTRHFRLDESIHTLSFLPINHVFEQVCGILLPLSLGGTVSFCESLKKIGENLAEVRPTFFLAVPAVYRMMYDRIMKNVRGQRLSNLLFSFPLTRGLVNAKVQKAFGAGTIFISGGAPLDPIVAEGMARLGLSVYQGYGITETAPVIAAESPGRRKVGTVGHALAGVEIRIDHPTDDQVGEIVVHGPNVMQGYYKNPQATAEVLDDGWYRTGDLGRLDPQGMLTICGRVKNLIVTPNGKNVYPEEVENELLNSPFIAEVMVYGHKITPTAEEVHALIFPDQEALDDHARSIGTAPMSVADVETLIRREVGRACNNLADYKRVKKFTLREDEFPKTTTRKIKRFEVEATISLP